MSNRLALDDDIDFETAPPDDQLSLTICAALHLMCNVKGLSLSEARERIDFEISALHPYVAYPVPQRMH